MRYKILNFEFDSKRLVLTKNGETFDIRHNEAKLLALLIENTHTILSKTDILSYIWQEKVVSEQAVFQNISHLRSIFGNDAIKTFSKRGYQWQLVITPIFPQPAPSTITPVAHSLKQLNNSTLNSKQLNPIINTAKSKVNYTLIISVLSILTLLVFLFINQADSKNPSSTSAINIAYIPFTNAENTRISTREKSNISFSKLPNIDAKHFTHSIELQYPLLAKQHSYVLTGELRHHNNITYLDFSLKGPSGDWSGQLSAASITEVNTKLIQHLQQPHIYKQLKSKKPLELQQAMLSIAHQNIPNDLINLSKLVSVYIKMEDLERAKVMAEKLETLALSQNDIQYAGNALLYQSEILTRKELFQLSASKLDDAKKQFKKINDLKRGADAWYAQSWISHLTGNYSDVKQSLLTSAKLAKQGNDITRELSALTYLSVLAYKNKQHQDKFTYLNQAERKMTTYKLPQYHFAILPFHYAIFAKTMSEKEPHYKRVLALTSLTPNHWIAQDSRKNLMTHYLSQNRLMEARALLADLKTNSQQNLLLKALLAQAQKKQDEFKRYALQTFEKAQLAGDIRESLDVALLICTEPDADINTDFYLQYIRENATKYWRRANSESLSALNI